MALNIPFPPVFLWYLSMGHPLVLEARLCPILFFLLSFPNFRCTLLREKTVVTKPADSSCRTDIHNLMVLLSHISTGFDRTWISTTASKNDGNPFAHGEGSSIRRTKRGSRVDCVEDLLEV